MTALLAANRCPACQVDHDYGPPGWPRCPRHGHYLYVLRGPLKTATAGGGGWAYACQGYDTPPGGRSRKCDYTHTQKEKATMTTTDGAALAIRADQSMWDARQLAALTQLGVENASKADLAVFLHRCQVTGLDPFAGQITMVRRGSRWVIQTGIDGYRVIAQRAAKRDGVTISYGPTKFYDRAGGVHEDIWVGDEPPVGASVTVYKDGKPFPGAARYASFAQTAKDGKPMAQWAIMPDHMIAKCAEAQALRKAFPYDLEGTAITDEGARGPAAPVAPPVVVQQVAADGWDEPGGDPKKLPHRPRGDVAGLRADCDDMFRDMGIGEEEEQAVYLCKLTNRDPAKGAGVLSERDLRFARDSLADCQDVEMLQNLVAPPESARDE